jgi:FkbM family methyltransferase
MKFNFFFVFLLSIFYVNSIDLIRLGSGYGGWLIPENLLSEDSVCYCAGVGEDVTFDIELIRMFNCKVFCIDPTPRSILHVAKLKESLYTGEEVFTSPEGIKYEVTSKILNNLFFVPMGLWSENKIMRFFSPRNKEHVSHSIVNLQHTKDFFEAECKRLSILMSEFGHKKLDLLKMNIEGAEGRILDSIIEDGLDIKCIIVAFDENRKGQKYILETDKRIESLKRNGYEIIYENNYNPVIFLKK